MDRHAHETFAPANKGDMTHLKEEVFAELSMMQRKLTTEVHMVPKLIGQDTRLEGLYFELWADNVREEKARRRLMHKIGSLEEETESAANGEENGGGDLDASNAGSRHGSSREVLVVHSRTSLREVVKHMAAQVRFVGTDIALFMDADSNLPHCRRAGNVMLCSVQFSSNLPHSRGAGNLNSRTTCST